MWLWIAGVSFQMTCALGRRVAWLECCGTSRVEHWPSCSGPSSQLSSCVVSVTPTRRSYISVSRQISHSAALCSLSVLAGNFQWTFREGHCAGMVVVLRLVVIWVHNEIKRTFTFKGTQLASMTSLSHMRCSSSTYVVGHSKTNFQPKWNRSSHFLLEIVNEWLIWISYWCCLILCQSPEHLTSKCQPDRWK